MIPFPPKSEIRETNRSGISCISCLCSVTRSAFHLQSLAFSTWVVLRCEQALHRADVFQSFLGLSTLFQRIMQSTRVSIRIGGVFGFCFRRLSHSTRLFLLLLTNLNYKIKEYVFFSKRLSERVDFQHGGWVVSVLRSGAR